MLKRIAIVCQLFFIGCTAPISGNVYIDENNNGFRDFDEPGAGSIRITVTKDGNLYDSGYTATNGSFSIKGTKGNICVILDQRDIEGSSTFTKTVAAESRVLDLSKQTVPVGTPGVVSSPSPSNPPTPSSGGSGNIPTAPASPPPPSNTGDTSTSSSGNSCKEASFAKGANFQIGIVPDYTQHFDEAPAPSERVVVPGEKLTHTQPYPCGCRLTCYVPSAMQGNSVDEDRLSLAAQPAIGVLQFDADLPPDDGVDRRSTDLCVEKIDLTVDEDIPERDMKSELKCTAYCPDGRHDLPATPYTIAGGVTITMEQVVLDTAVLGQPFNVRVVLNNRRGVRIDQLDLEFTVTPSGSGIAVDSVDRTDICNDSLPIRCSPGFQEGETRQEILIQYRLPASVAAERTYRIQALLSGPKLERSVTDDISLRLAP